MKEFKVVTTPLFNRLIGKLTEHHSELPGVLKTAVAILGSDPYNITRSHPIRKLRGVKAGEGQFRLRSGRWGFRYDVWDKKREVELSYCGLRREDTYR